MYEGSRSSAAISRAMHSALSGRDRSQEIVCARCPAARMLHATLAICGARRAVRTTSWPFWAKTCASAAPIPEDAPVIKAAGRTFAIEARPAAAGESISISTIHPPPPRLPTTTMPPAPSFTFALGEPAPAALPICKSALRQRVQSAFDNRVMPTDIQETNQPAIWAAKPPRLGGRTNPRLGGKLEFFHELFPR